MSLHCRLFAVLRVHVDHAMRADEMQVYPSHASFPKITVIFSCLDVTAICGAARLPRLCDARAKKLGNQWVQPKSRLCGNYRHVNVLCMYNAHRIRGREPELQ